MPEINPRQITFARSRRRYTKKRLADELGVTSRTIQNYEAGTPAPDEAMLSRIALLLNFPSHSSSWKRTCRLSANTPPAFGRSRK